MNGLARMNEFKAAAVRDLKGRATAEDMETLSADLTLWLRVLVRIEMEVDSHIGAWHARLKAEGRGATPGEQWKAADRVRFKQTTRSRRGDVADMLSTTGLTRSTIGTMIEALIAIEEVLSEDNVSDAHQMISGLIDRLERQEVGADVVRQSRSDDYLATPDIRVTSGS